MQIVCHHSINDVKWRMAEKYWCPFIAKYVKGVCVCVCVGGGEWSIQQQF